MSIEDTRQSDPMVHLMGGMSGMSGYIEGMESAGQAQVVHSDKIPVGGYTSEDLEVLGFKLGPVVDGDELFRTCELPEGWYREGTEHAMHSVIRDERGYKRIGIFYKAAFYDRRADAHIVPVPSTKAQDDARDQPPNPTGHEHLWMSLRDRREGDNYVYCWRGRYGDAAPVGKHAYSDDGRRLEVTIAPDGSVVDSREFEVEPDARL